MSRSRGAWARAVCFACVVMTSGSLSDATGALPREATASASSGLDARCEPGAVRLRSPVQQYDIVFTEAGLRVLPRGGGADLGWALTGVGRAGELVPVAPATPHAEGSVVTYVRPQLEEWHVNRPVGMEQGVTIRERIPGDGPLRLGFASFGPLCPEVVAGGRTLLFRDQRDAVRFRHAGLVAWDARGRDVPVRFEVIDDPESVETFAFVVEDAGAEYPVTVDPCLFNEDARLLPSDHADDFGRALAIDGDTAVVSAREFDDGTAYVYVRPLGGWHGDQTEVARLVPSDTMGASFGQAVALDGDTVVVGAPGSATAYVFEKPPSGWTGTITESARLTQSDFNLGDRYAFSVAISGRTVVVGAAAAHVGIHRRGAAYVFVEPAGGWSGTVTEDARLEAGDALESQLGAAVAVFGSMVVAGSPDARRVPQPGPGAGAAYVFVEPPAGWSGVVTESAKLVPSSSSFGAADFGAAVAIASGHVFVGAPRAFVDPFRNGAAFVFDVPPSGSSGDLTEQAMLLPSDPVHGDQFGRSIAAHRHRVVVGSTQRGVPAFAPARTGAAYVFVEPAGGWSGSHFEERQLVAGDAEVLSGFARAVATFDATVLASWRDSPGGPAVHVFLTNEQVPPCAECRDLERMADLACDGGTVTVDDVDGGTLDLDGDLDVTCITAVDGVPEPCVDQVQLTGLGSFVVELTAIDLQGSTDTCEALVTIGPNITCPSDVVLGCGDSTDPSFTGIATSSCMAGVDHVDRARSGECGNASIIERTWTASAAGLEAQCVQLITLVANRAPVARCQSVTLTTDGTCTATLSVSDVDAGSDDPDGNLDTTCITSVDGTPVACADSVDFVDALGTHLVTLTAFDSEGESDECTAAVHVRDTLAPSLFGVPDDVSAGCADLPSPALVTAVDACDGDLDVSFVESRVDGPCPFSYRLVRSWSSVDSSGNVATASQVVMVDDVTPPVVTALLAPSSPPVVASPLSVTAPRSRCHPPTSGAFTVHGTASDDCSTVEPTLRVVTTNTDIVNGLPRTRIDVHPVRSGDLIELVLVSPVRAASASSPRVSMSVTSQGLSRFIGESVVLEVTAVDDCGNASRAEYDPSVEPSPDCREQLEDGTCCPAVGRPAGRGSRPFGAKQW